MQLILGYICKGIEGTAVLNNKKPRITKNSLSITCYLLALSLKPFVLWFWKHEMLKIVTSGSILKACGEKHFFSWY